MRLAFIGIKALPSDGGPERVVEALVTRMRGRHQITVYCSSRRMPKGASVDGVELLRMPVLPGKRLHAVSLFVISALHACLFRRFDLIHLHNAEGAFVLPILRLRYPVVSTSHGAAYDRDKWRTLDKKLMKTADRFFLRLSTEVTSVSLPLAGYYRDKYGAQVAYIPNGVEPAAVEDRDIAESLKKYSLERDGYLMFAAGRIDPTKGCHFLLEAYRSMPEVNLPLVIVGDPRHAAGYEERLHQLSDGRTKFVSFVSDKKELFSLVKGARLFIFPSTVEAMSMMLLEVAALKVPLLASDIPENLAVLPEEALFFKSADAADLSTKLKWALSNAEQMNMRAEKSHEMVLKSFDWNGVVESYEQAYGKCLDRRKNTHTN